MSQFQSLVQALNEPNVSSLALGGGRITQMLEALAIVQQLSRLGELTSPIDQPIGLEERLEILLTAAARAAELTGTPADDQWVARARAELMQPEVLAFAAYMLRRTKAAG